MEKNRYNSIMRKAFIIVICLQFFFFPAKTDDQTTLVTVFPSNSSVQINEIFTVDIYCEPVQEMKAFEFSISFDENLLQVNSVTEGDIFDGYDTFFNDGTIDNNNGEVSLIYGLILGSDTVSEPGSLVSVSFTAQQTPGSCNLLLSDVGITNETSYIPISISHGTVVIEDVMPSINNVSSIISTPYDTDPSFGWCRFSCDVVDNDIDRVYHVLTCPDETVINRSMTQEENDVFSLNLSYLSYGSYSYHIFAIDTEGNSISSDEISLILAPNWDIDQNGVCNIFDFTLVSNRYNAEGKHGWIREDVDNDGIVELSDILMISGFYNQAW